MKGLFRSAALIAAFLFAMPAPQPAAACSSTDIACAAACNTFGAFYAWVLGTNVSCTGVHPWTSGCGSSCMQIHVDYGFNNSWTNNCVTVYSNGNVLSSHPSCP